MILRPLRRAALAGAASLALAAPAQASCNGLSFGSFSTTAYAGSGSGGSYDVFDEQAIGVTVTFTVTKTSNGSCSYQVGASDGLTNSFSPRRLISGGGLLNYNLYTSSSRANVLQDKPTPNSNLISGSFRRSGTNTHTYFYFIPPQQIVRPGTYFDLLTFEIYIGGDNSPEATKTVPHTATVLPQAEISVVPPNGAFNRSSTTQSFDFGTLREGQLYSVDVLARGNNGFDLTMQSLNRQTLMIQNVAVESSIPYSITVSGASANLTGSSSATVASVGGPTSLDGNRFPVMIRIGAVPPTQTAGNYRDSITVSVISK